MVSFLTTTECRLRVESAILAVGRRLPVYPNERTSSDRLDMSQTWPITEVATSFRHVRFYPRNSRSAAPRLRRCRCCCCRQAQILVDSSIMAKGGYYRASTAPHDFASAQADAKSRAAQTLLRLHLRAASETTFDVKRYSRSGSFMEQRWITLATFRHVAGAIGQRAVGVIGSPFGGLHSPL
jgi:hypothetical protein